MHDILELQKHLWSFKIIFTSLHLNMTSTSTFDHAWFVPFLNHWINKKDCIYPFQFLLDHGIYFYGLLDGISYYQTSTWCDTSSSWHIFQDGYTHTMQEDYDNTTKIFSSYLNMCGNIMASQWPLFLTEMLDLSTPFWKIPGNSLIRDFLCWQPFIRK